MAPKKKQDTLAKLKIQRDVLMVKITSNIGRSETAIESQSLSEMELSSEHLLQNKKQLDRLNTNIFDLTDEDEASAECTTAAQYESNVVEAIAKLSFSIKRANFNSAASESSLSPIALPSDQSQKASGGSVKLPKLDIEKFSGDPLTWNEFWDGFKSTIHDNDKLAKVDKFKYLKHYICGDALQMLKGYELSAANYKFVIDALVERFGQKDVIINAHFDALQSLPEATHDTKSLYAVLDKCEMHIRSLAALGVAEDVFEQVFAPQILRKLPKFVRLEVVRRNGSNPWKMSALREYIRDEIRIRDMAGQSQQSSEKHPKSIQSSFGAKNGGNQLGNTAFGNGKTSKAGTADALVTGTAGINKNSRLERNPKCPFCNGEHYADQCTKYPDTDSRRIQIKGKCFRCLGSLHLSKNCRRRPKKCYHCQSVGHHRSLCNKKFGKSGSQENSSVVTSDTVEPKGNLDPNAKEFVPSCSISTRAGRAIMQTALAEVIGGNGKRTKARLMFDTASSRTFVTKVIAESINATKLGKETIYLSAFGDEQRRCIQYDLVELYVLGRHGKKIPIEAYATENITCPVRNAKLDTTKIPILSQVTLAEPLNDNSNTLPVDILVGGDFYYDFVGSGQIKVGNGIILLESELGFIVTGRENNVIETNCAVEDTSLLISHESKSGVQLDLEQFWRLEEIGIKDKVEQTDDERAMELFTESVEFKDRRYAVAWPWKHSKATLPSNKKMAFAQLQSNLRNLKKNEKLLSQYHEVIKDQEKKGVIEVVQPENEILDGQGIHYLKHHCVLNPQSETTKVRVVHNASAKARGQSLSLNECLYQGPLIMEDLCGILMRFRLWPIGIVSDIEKAFLQIQILPSERNVVRFLWVKDLLKPAVGDNVVHYRFTRVLFGMVASSFLLAATIQHHLSKINTPVSHVIARNTYIDNIIAGAYKQEEGKEYYDESKDIFLKCSMNIRQWFTNDPELAEYIPEKDKGKATEPKVLGLSWNLSKDTLSCPKTRVEICPAEIQTKRKALQVLARIYDPCGFFAPVTVTGKILMQKIWTAELNWDDALPTEIMGHWQRYAEDLKKIPNACIPRWIGVDCKSVPSIVQLHAFCDASMSAYNAVVYIRIEQHGKVKTCLLFAKTRVKPLKQITIPRLELLALLVGVRLIIFIEQELRIRIDAKYVWTDSLCVLQWLQKQTSKSVPVFIENRLREIRKAKGLSFRHVRSHENPADLGSRGCSYDNILGNRLWWEGPRFLCLSETSWPKESRIEDPGNSQAVTPCDDECEVSQIQCEDRIRNKCCLETIIDIEKYSTLFKLLRVTAVVLRAFKNPTAQYISATEVSVALKKWILDVQSSLQSTVMLNKGNLKQLQPFIDIEGYIRCRGRLEMANIPENTKYPILLPKEHRLTKLVIKEVHKEVGHAGVSHTLAQVRSNYWIPQGRSAVKSVLRECRICRRYKAKPYKIPEQPALPDFRVQRSDPFQRVGIDYLGPMYVVSGNSAADYNKAWICLFTCATIRAVHLEVVTRLNTEEFILALRRFVAKYGRPDLFVCDNAPNFHLAEKTVNAWWKELQEDEKTLAFASKNQIEWKFVTEMAPWMGGFYERMIQIVKICLIKTLGKRKVSLIELQTISAEIATTVNTRPLLKEDNDLSSEYLTPSHFLCPRQKKTVPTPEFDTEFQPESTSSDKIILVWKRTQLMLESYWKMWHQSYLTSLREQWQQKRQRNTEDIQPKVGTVVLVKDPGLNRGQWRLGKITELHESFDGKVRSVTLKTSSGLLNRPIKLLSPLEWDVNTDAEPEWSEEGDKQSHQRPTRKAAIGAKQRIQQQLDDLAD